MKCTQGHLNLTLCTNNVNTLSVSLRKHILKPHKYVRVPWNLPHLVLPGMKKCGRIGDKESWMWEPLQDGNNLQKANDL